LSKITDIVSALALPIAENIGVELWDVEFVKEGSERYLRIFIDREDGITIDLCEGMSRSIDPLLDDLDCIPEPYILEVSSAGLERELKKPEHYERFIGAEVEVKLYKAVDGAKKFAGRLLSCSGGGVSIDAGGKIYSFESSAVSQTRLKPDFSKY
jgi:ribosome maturation factor RimP